MTPPTPPPGPGGRPARERILAIGGTGEGKSTALLSIALWHQRRGSDARFFVLSSGDLAYEQMLSAERYAGLTNIEYEDCFEYGDWVEHGRAFLKKARKRAEANGGQSNDWLVPDLYSTLWPATQDYYMENVTGTAGEDFWTAAAKRAEGSNNGFELFADLNWTAINRFYREFSQKVMGRWPGHVFAVAAAKPVEKDRGGKVTEADANIANWFGRLGVKPAGQKDMAYEFRDIVVCRRLASGMYTLTTAKAREREVELKGQEWDRNFFQRFMMPVCNWSA